MFLEESGRISNFIELADVKIDTTGGKVTKSGEEIFLSALEYRLLLIFAANKGNVLSRNKLLEEIWDASGEFVNDNTLTVYIKRLREKIENDPQRPEIIKTVRRYGIQVSVTIDDCETHYLLYLNNLIIAYKSFAKV